MNLSRCDAFRPCSRDTSGDKGQLYFTVLANLSVHHCYFKTFRLQLPTTLPITGIHSLVKAFQMYHCYKAIDEIYNLLPHGF